MGISDIPTIIEPEQSFSKSGNLLYSEEEVDYSPLIPRGEKEESFEFESRKEIERGAEVLGELKAPEVSFIFEKIEKIESLYSETLSEKPWERDVKKISHGKPDIGFSREIVNEPELNLHLNYYSRLIELWIFNGYSPSTITELAKGDRILKNNFEAISNPKVIAHDLDKLYDTIKVRRPVIEPFASTIAHSLSEPLFEVMEKNGIPVLDREKKEYEKDIEKAVMKVLERRFIQFRDSLSSEKID